MASTIDYLNWKAIASHSWITVNPTEGTGNANITITTDKGNPGDETTGTVTITCDGQQPKIITVIRCIKKSCSKETVWEDWSCEGKYGEITVNGTAYTNCFEDENGDCICDEVLTSKTENCGEPPSTCTDPEFSGNEYTFACKINTLPFDYKDVVSFNDCCELTNVNLSDDTNWEYSSGTTNDKKVIKIRPTSNHIGSVDGNSRSCTVTVSTSCDDSPSETAVTVTQSYCNTGQTCTECICYIVGNATGDANWNDENTTVKWSYTAVTTNSDCTKTSTTGESSQSVTFSKNDACGTVTRTGSFTWTDHKSCDNDNNCTNNDININWSVSQAGKEIKITGGDGITDCNPGTIIFKIEDK